MTGSEKFCSNCGIKETDIDSADRRIKGKKNFTRGLLLTATVFCLILIIVVPQTTLKRKCLFAMPQFLEDIFRAPANCQPCLNLVKIPRLKQVDPVNFMNQFAYSGVPAVVEDCTENWSAKNLFDVDFFLSLYSQKNESNCQFFKYKTKFTSLQNALTSISHGASDEFWYIGWSNCDNEIGDILRQHYSKPYFLTEDSESASTDWIFMGTPGYGAQKHVDNVKYPSWQAQIKGTKKWILYPPPECYYTCSTAFYEVILNAGDTIIVDTNMWYHETHVISNEISISIGSEFD